MPVQIFPREVPHIFSVLTICVFLTSPRLFANDQELFEAIVKSTGWLAKVQENSHELECIVRRDTRREAPPVSSQLARVLREASEKSTGKFIVAETRGFFYVDLLKGEHRDSVSQVITKGDSSTYARRSLTLTGTVRTYPCGQDGQSCLEKSRAWDLGDLPAMFLITSPDAEQKELEHIAEFFASGDAQVSRKRVKIRLHGVEQEVIQYRVFEHRRMDSGSFLAFGYDLSIGTTGAAKGMLVEFSQAWLNWGATEYKSSKDVLYVMRKNQTKWGTIDQEGEDEVVVPLRVDRFRNSGPSDSDASDDGAGSVREEFLFTWKDTGKEDWVLPTEAEFEKRLAEDKETVDRILGR